MRKLIALIAFYFFLSSQVFAATYIVDQDGTGNGGANYSIAELEAGASPFDDLDGDKVCLTGSLQKASGYLTWPDFGSSGSIVTVDGACDGYDQAEITVNGGSIGIYGVDAQYITFQNINIRNADDDTAAYGFKFFCGSGAGSNVIFDNIDGQLYGSSSSAQTYVIWARGDLDDWEVKNSNIVGLNIYSYDGINLGTSNAYGGSISNISIHDNIIDDWGHNGAVVLLLESTGWADTMTDVEIYDNTFDGYNRGYGRAISIITTSGGSYALGAVKRIWIHDNIIDDHRSPQQIAGQYLAYYRNFVSDTRNACENSPTYDGDSDCQEEYEDAAGSYGTGQGVETGLDVSARMLWFKNTFYSNKEYALGLRNSGQGAANTKDWHVVGNVFVDNAVWSSSGDTGDPSDFLKADCTIFVEDVGSTDLDGAIISKNIFYNPTDSQTDIFCTARNDSGAFANDSTLYAFTVAELEAEQDEDPGGDWESTELTASDNDYSDPILLSSSTGDFRLQATSPAIDKGIWTTVKSSSGSGTSFCVADALFLGAPGETIKTAAGQSADLVSITYADNTNCNISGVDYDYVTVDESISFVQDEGVGLLFYGASPDAGAEEYPGYLVNGTSNSTVNSTSIGAVNE